MPTFAVFEKVGGRLVSLGTSVADPLPLGLEVLVLPGNPDLLTQRWDGQTRSFVPRVFRDRVEDVLADSRLNGLTQSEKASLRAVLLEHFPLGLRGYEA